MCRLGCSLLSGGGEETGEPVLPRPRAFESVTEIPGTVQILEPGIREQTFLKRGEIENVLALWAMWSASQLLSSATVAQKQLQKIPKEG